jgi:hypothetical protein
VAKHSRGGGDRRDRDVVKALVSGWALDGERDGADATPVKGRSWLKSLLHAHVVGREVR